MSINYQLIIDYINKEYDRDLKRSPMYEQISKWRQWLEGDVKGFHTYKMKTDLTDGKKKRTMHRHKTNMLLKGSEDWASILLNEKTEVVIDDEPSQRFVMGDDVISGVFGDNDFWRCANELVATSRWSGTGAFEIYVKDMDISDSSNDLVSGSKIGINFLAADQIIPISWDNTIARECAFVSERVLNGRDAYLVSVHTLDENGNYDIEYLWLDEYGVKIDRENYGEIIHTHSPVPWFSIIRKSGLNVFDTDSPFGVSIISGAEDVLRGLDCAFDNFITDFKLGRKMVFMSKSMFDADEDGKLVAPQEDDEQLFINAGDTVLDNQKMYHEYNPALRVEDNAGGLQKMLDLFSFRIGLGTHRYQLEGTSSRVNIKTATEYTGERQDMVQNATKEMICVEKALKEVVRAILWIGKYVLRENVNPDALIVVNSDDSYIIDTETEKAQWKEDVKMGLRTRVEYRMHFYGESEEEAKKNIEPTFGELLEGKAQGVVSDLELRRYLYPAETPEQAEQAVAEIKNQILTLAQIYERMNTL